MDHRDCSDCTRLEDWAEHRGVARRVVRSIGLTCSQVDDVVQETFLRLCRTCRTGETPKEVEAWLLVVAQNIAWEAVRRAATRGDTSAATLREDEHAARGRHDPQAQVIAVEFILRVRIQLFRLPARVRRAFELRLLDRSTAEIAVELGVSERTIKYDLLAARTHLQRALREFAPPE